MSKLKQGKHGNNSGKIRTTLAIVICLVAVFCAGYFVSSKVTQKKAVVVGGTNTTDKKTKTNKVNDDKQKDNTQQQAKENTSEFAKLTKNVTGNVTPVVTKDDGKTKVAYLTFDDGPSANITPGVLKVLRENNVHGTFFLMGKMAQRHPDLVKEEIEEGNAIGNHSYSHEYKKIYASPEAFLEDINKCFEVLKKIVPDYDANLVRFPGGSYGHKLLPIREAVKAKGIKYVNWNALTGDAEHNNVPADKLVERLKVECKGKNRVVILTHDAPTKRTSLEALPRVIEYLKSQGYKFETLH